MFKLNMYIVYFMEHNNLDLFLTGFKGLIFAIVSFILLSEIKILFCINYQ